MGIGTVDDPFTLDDIKLPWYEFIWTIIKHPKWTYRACKDAWKLAMQERKK